MGDVPDKNLPTEYTDKSRALVFTQVATVGDRENFRRDACIPNENIRT